MCLTNSQLVQYLADGYTIPQIAKETGMKVKAIEQRIYVIKKTSISTTAAHLVANFLRKKIID